MFNKLQRVFDKVFNAVLAYFVLYILLVWFLLKLIGGVVYIPYLALTTKHAYEFEDKLDTYIKKGF